MKPAIFIHLKNDVNFLKYCLKNFKNKCIIVTNCYGNKEDIITFCRENSDHFYQCLSGGKNDIVKSIPLLFPDGVWVCNDDVVVEGDVWRMFEFANSDRENIDLVYPPTDSLLIDNTKIGVHNRHRLSSSAYFLTANGIKKLRLGHPLSYTYTYYGVNIKHVQNIKTLELLPDQVVSFYQEKTYSPVRANIKRQLMKAVTSELQPINTKNVIITLATDGRDFLSRTKKLIKEIATAWEADFKIYYKIEEVLTVDEINQLSKVQSNRTHIINYFAKMKCVWDALQNYDRVLWIDDTSIISPFCQNIFSVVPHDQFGALVIKRNSGMGECLSDLESIKQKRGIEIDDLYINSGVMVVSKLHQDLFSFEQIIKDVDLFESFYPTQAYIAYKITVDKISVFDVTTVNHLMPAMLKYEDKLFTQAETLMPDIKRIAAHNIVHFSGFHRNRDSLHREVVEQFNNIFDQNITIVIMNYSRPDNIKNKILPWYTKIPAINEIVVSHCKESVKFDYPSTEFCKVLHRDDVNTNVKYGLFTRYVAAAESSTNECVVVVDDDMIIPSHVLSQLFYLWKQNPSGVYGTRGRNINKTKNGWVYDDTKYVEQADVLLTHCAMTSHLIFKKLLTQEHYFHDLAMKAIVPWNGEDILLSTFAKFLNQKKHTSLHAEYVDLSNENAVSATADHKHVRDMLVTEIYKHYTKKIYEALL